MESGNHGGSGTIMSIHGFGIGVGGSISLPNLRRSKMDPGIRSEIRPFLPQIKPGVEDVDLTSRHRFRSCSSPSIMKGSEFFCERRLQNPISIPAFGAHDGFRKGSRVPNASEMIVGALKASHVHFQRGMHHSDVIELVSSAYKLSNSTSVIRMLTTTLEKLVATGVVSKSYGVKNEDATYRLIMYNPKIAAMDPKLIVSGTGIKSSSAHPRSRSGLCLPGSSSHLTRVARTCSSHTQGNKIGNPINPQYLTNQTMSRAYASISDPTLAQSLADRSGAQERLQPHGYPPNSPVSATNDPHIPGIGRNFKHPIDFSKQDSTYEKDDCDGMLSIRSGVGDHEMRSDVLQRLRLQEYVAGHLASIGSFGDGDKKYGSIGVRRPQQRIGALTGRMNKDAFSQDDDDMLCVLEGCRSRYPDF